MWRQTGDFGSLIYITNADGSVSQVNLLDPSNGLVTQAEKQQAGSAGADAQIALGRLKSMYGIDFNAIPAHNMADVQGTLKGGYNDAEGSLHVPIQTVPLSQAANQQMASYTTQTMNGPGSGGTGVSRGTLPIGSAPGSQPTAAGGGAQGNLQLPSGLGNLQPGMTGNSVKQLQTWLVQNGYMTQAQVNTGYGTYGPQTTAAVAALQKDLGVNAGQYPGYFGPQTQTAIQSALSKMGSKTQVTLGNGQTAYVDAQGNYTDAQGNPMTDASVAGSTAGSGAGATDTPNAGTQSTGNPTLDSILTALRSYVQNQLSIGNKVNPNLQITPDLVQQFLGEAHQAIDPQSQQLLTNEVNNINANLKTLSTQYQSEQGNQVQQFQTDLNTERNNAGNTGTAFSGMRGLTENNMAATTNRNLASLDAGYGQRAGDILRAGGADLGSGVPGLNGSTASFNLPNMATASVGLAGPRGSSITGGALPTNYDPANYTFGTLGENYNTNLANTSNAFLGSYLGSAANNSARSFQSLNGNTPALM